MNPTMRRVFPAFLLLPLAMATAPMFVRPQAVPVTRLVKNLEAYLKKRPKDHHLVYKMARLHYLAFVNNATLVPAFELPERPPEPAPDHLAEGFLWWLRHEEASLRARKRLGIDDKTKMTKETWKKLDEARREEMEKLEASGWKPKAPSMDELHEHAEQAALHFERAIELAPDVTLYRLGRACLWEQCLDYELAGKLPRRRMIKPMATVTYAQVRDRYYQIFKRAHAKDVETGVIPVEGLGGLVSHEAGRAFLRLTEKSKKLREGQKERVAEVRKGLTELRELKRGPITPILVGGVPGDRLGDLLDPRATVSFDMDGDGVREDWPWVRRRTGILVWDPHGSKDIESGRQLFGSVTFFLFHRDGYRALQLLDDDQDGWLRDLELRGLSIWRDANGDGRSSPEEVHPVWEDGVVAIGTTSRAGPDGSLENPAGVAYVGGRVVPTFDWITQRR